MGEHSLSTSIVHLELLESSGNEGSSGVEKAGSMGVIDNAVVSET